MVVYARVPFEGYYGSIYYRVPFRGPLKLMGLSVQGSGSCNNDPLVQCMCERPLYRSFLTSVSN